MDFESPVLEFRSMKMWSIKLALGKNPASTTSTEYVLLSFQLCGGDSPYLSPEKLENKHKEIREGSLAMFLGTRKMGGVEFSKEYAQKLLSDIEESYENFVKLNDSKNIFNAARTPAVFFTLVVIAYFMSSVFASVGLLSFVRMFNLIIWAGLLAILLWSYVRFSGEFREMGARLDHLAELIWDEVSRTLLFLKWLVHMFIF